MADKLMQMADKLRQAIVPAKPVNKMSKSELLEFIEEKSVVDRMKIYYGKQEGKKLKSKIHEAIEAEESLVPELADFRNMKVSKIRKTLKTWHKDTQINSKLHKLGANKIRNLATRHMWEEMLYHDESLNFGDEEKEGEVDDKKPKKTSKKKTPKKIPQTPGSPKKHPSHHGVTVVVNTSEKKKRV